MPFARPTLTDLRQLALQDVYAVLGVKGLLRFAVLRVLSWVAAGLAHLHYGYLDWIARQSVPFTAEGEYLEAWAALVGILRKAAAAAGGSMVISGTAGAGVLAGTIVRRAGDAVDFITLADATIGGGGTVAVAIAARVAGVAGNTDADVQIALLSPIIGVSGVALQGAVVGGADQEQDGPFRTRMLRRWASPPQGGDADDYVEWALAVPGVTRAWANPLGAGAGTVVVYTMFDDVEAAHGGFPQGSDGVAAAETRAAPATGDQLTVANAIYPLRPVTALVFSVSAIPAPQAFVIHPKTAVPIGVQALIGPAIDAEFIVSASPLGAELELSPFETAIAAVPGMPDFTLTMPAGPITTALGHLPTRGAISYV